MTRDIPRALGASGSAAFRMRRPGQARGQLDERRDVGGSRGVVHARAAAGEEQHRPAVEHPLDEHPLPGLPRTRAVDLGGAQHGDRDAAIQQHLLGRDLIRRVSLPGPVVTVPRGDRGLVFPDRAGEAGLDLRVRVVASRVHVHGLTGDQHGRGGVAGQGEQAGRVLRRVTGAVHEEVGAGPEHGPQPPGAGPVRGDEPAARGGDVAGHPARVTAGQVDRPARRQQPPGGGPADGPGPADDDCPPHPGTVP